jgi:hypothetical protein
MFILRPEKWIWGLLTQISLAAKREKVAGQGKATFVITAKNFVITRNNLAMDERRFPGVAAGTAVSRPCTRCQDRGFRTAAPP